MNPSKYPEEESLILPNSNRVLNYAIYGDPEAVTATVFFNHGLPGSHIEAWGYSAAARRLGLRIIAVDRPGFGGSAPVEPDRRRMLDWPADILALADALDVQRFAVLGVSGGSPYTLACLHMISRTRCVGAGIVAGLYPAHLGREGMMLSNRLLMCIAAWSPWLVEKALDFDLRAAIAAGTAGPEKLEALLASKLKARSAPDYHAWQSVSDETRAIVVEDLRRGLVQGSRASAWELHLGAIDWGFKLEDIEIESGRVVMWHGVHDVNIPIGMAREAHSLIRGADLRISETAGHLSMSFDSINDVVETLGRIIAQV
ncbi:alpha/beta-hydrolase [Xylariaceae sp. FL0255]|nr:alpha/beta-hydrolase [Xylariaceae sp. FL0255]